MHARTFRKRTLALLLTVAVFIGILSVGALAAILTRALTA